LVVAACAAGCGGDDGAGAGPEVRALAAEGGCTLTLYRVKTAGQGQRPPGLLLFTRPGGPDDAWAAFAEWLRERGIFAAVLSAPGPDAAWGETLACLTTATAALIDAGADPANLVVAGSGRGAVLALAFAREDPVVQGVIAVTPEAAAADLNAREQLEGLRDCPVLVLASEGDPHGAALARALQAAAPGFCELRSFRGAAYGAALLEEHGSARDQALLWVRTILGTPEDGGAGG